MANYCLQQLVTYILRLVDDSAAVVVSHSEDTHALLLCQLPHVAGIGYGQTTVRRIHCDMINSGYRVGILKHVADVVLGDLSRIEQTEIYLFHDCVRLM